MKKKLLAISLAFSSTLAIAQQQTYSQNFAAPTCESGCRAVTGDTMIYVGTTPKTYRICRITDYRASIYVDGKDLGDLRQNSDGVRTCLDVSGSRIGVSTIGTVAVGLVTAN